MSGPRMTCLDISYVAGEINHAYLHKLGFISVPLYTVHAAFYPWPDSSLGLSGLLSSINAFFILSSSQLPHIVSLRLVVTLPPFKAHQIFSKRLEWRSTLG